MAVGYYGRLCPGRHFKGKHLFVTDECPQMRQLKQMGAFDGYGNELPEGTTQMPADESVRRVSQFGDVFPHFHYHHHTSSSISICYIISIHSSIFIFIFIIFVQFVRCPPR
ncbi:hypothetical protein niasHS_010126 [Heterodera schachtii]|uniref:Uncharacterized protein n=1 Tax=Heterodera schachtii TaxID=97005 RepID=A0ABD2IYT1_HETSC